MNAGTRTMRGVVLVGPAQAELREVAVPPAGAGEILVRVDAATTCGTDVKVYRRGGHPRMLEVPTLFGHEMAGTVVEVGTGVDRFTVGDEVVVLNSAPCGDCAPCLTGRENLCENLQYLNGGYAEFIRVPPRFVAISVHRLPKSMSMGRAAMTEPLACVLHGIEACDLDRVGGGNPAEVVVYGAGPIGLLFVAALAHAGHHVILADPNPPRLEVGRRLGAHQVVEIQRGGGQSERVRAHCDHPAGPIVAVDCTGVPAVWSDAIDTVRPGGIVNLFGGCAPGTRIELDTHRLHYSELTVKGVYHHRPATVRRALALLRDEAFVVDPILTGECGLDGVVGALEDMIAKRELKVVVRPSS